LFNAKVVFTAASASLLASDFTGSIASLIGSSHDGIFNTLKRVFE
jgi:hypothetical protein